MRLYTTFLIILVYFRLKHNQVRLNLSLRSHGEKVRTKTWCYTLEDFSHAWKSL